MSHATVMIIQGAKSKKTIRDLMDPYDENMEVAPYIYKTKKQFIKDYKATLKKILTDGEEGQYLADPFNEKWTSDPEHVKYLQDNIKKYNEVLSGELPESEVYLRACEWNGIDIDEDTDEDGNILSRYNKNAKWDWYEIGGRWSGLLTLKDGSNADSAKAKNIDWEAMYSLDSKEEDRIRKFWKYYVDEEPIPDEIAEEVNELISGVFYKREYFKDRYGSAERYIKECATFLTHAVITKTGAWKEAGRMGWFGCSSESDAEAREWTDTFRSRFIDTLNPNDIVTIVDYHI